MGIRVRQFSQFHIPFLGLFVALAITVGFPKPAYTHGEIYLVREGETLSEIAQRFSTTTENLRHLNGLVNVDVIYYGLPLVVPDDGDEATIADNESKNSVVSEQMPNRRGKWIDVDLSEQLVTPYEDMTPIRSFIVSTGLPGTPTVTGEFRIWAKTAVQDMYGGNRAAGDYYYLEDVQWVQYFFEDYAFHGTYWHENFGQPMSRGCVNMRNEDAKWLFDWAAPVQSDTDGT